MCLHALNACPELIAGESRYDETAPSAANNGAENGGCSTLHEGRYMCITPPPLFEMASYEKQLLLERDGENQPGGGFHVRVTQP